MPTVSRAATLLFLAWIVMPVTTPAAELVLRLIVMEPELDGDTSDASRRAEWQDRLDLLAERVSSELSAADLYDVLDPGPAEAEFAKHRHRAAVYACDVCARSVARATDADRVLSLRVFRLSNLILSLHAIVRDGPSGAVRYARVLDFRGDNDRSWLRAADYLIRDLSQLPPAQR